MRPSLQKVLLQEFEAFLLSKITSDKHKKGKRPYEVDAIAISNGSTDAAYVVEIKSRFRPKDLNQILKNLNWFPEVFVEYADLEVYGVVAVVEISEKHKEMLFENGLYNCCQRQRVQVSRTSCRI